MSQLACASAVLHHVNHQRDGLKTNSCRTFRPTTRRLSSLGPASLQRPSQSRRGVLPLSFRPFEGCRFAARRLGPALSHRSLPPPRGEAVIHVALPLISCNTAFISAAAIASIFLPPTVSAGRGTALPPPQRPLRRSSLARTAKRRYLSSSPSPPPPRHLQLPGRFFLLLVVLRRLAARRCGDVGNVPHFHDV